MPQTQADFDRAFGIKHVEANGCVYIGVQGPEAWQTASPVMSRYEARMAAKRIEKEQADSLVKEVHQ